MLVTEDFLYDGTGDDGGWTQEQLRLLGVYEFARMPDLYWKNRILLTEISEGTAQAFLAAAGKGNSPRYYERKTCDRRFSRFPNLMYFGVKPDGGYTGIPELANISPPSTDWQINWDYTAYWGNGIDDNKPGAKITSPDGGWEEYWKYGELFFIRANTPITKPDSEAALLRFRNIAPFTAACPQDYRSVSCRLDWNYKHTIVKDGDDLPIHGIDRDRGSKIIMRFAGGSLHGDTRTRGGKLLVKPAFQDGGHIEYWRMGFLHRGNNQPAVIAENIKEWWINGVFIKAELE
jgi:hypothetical protein